MFKKFKIAKAENKAKTFFAPQIKKTQVFNSYKQELFGVQKILMLSRFPQKRNTLYRLIIDMSMIDIDKNIYILADVLLSCLLKDEKIDKSFYTTFNKIIKSKKKNCIKDICYNYLITQLLICKEYTDFLEYIMKNFVQVIYSKEEAIIKVIDKVSVIERIKNLKNKHKTKYKIYEYNEPIYYLR